MTAAAAALALCLATPVPQAEVIAQLVHDGYRFAYAGPLSDGMLLVLTLDDQGRREFMVVMPDETACRLRTLENAP